MNANPRLTRITDRLVRDLKNAIADLEITEPELMQALAFLTEVGKRDQSILLSDVLGLSVAANNRTYPDRPGATPANVQGPLYRPGAPLRPAPVRLCADDEPGEVLFVSGRVVSARDGRALPGALLDIWQANHAGRYENEDASQPDFNLRGRFHADAEGRYEFRTVVPGAYRIAGEGPVGRLLAALGRPDWRPGHIHARVTADGFAPLTTQIYMPDDPWLDADAIGAVKPLLVAQLERQESALAMRERGLDRPFFTGRFDFRLMPV